MPASEKVSRHEIAEERGTVGAAGLWGFNVRRFGAKPDKKIVDRQAASPSSWKTPFIATRIAERDPIELVQDGTMETLADAICLRALGLGAAVVDVLDGEVELVFVALGATNLGAAIGQH